MTSWVSLPFLISQPAWSPNWKFRRRSSMRPALVDAHEDPVAGVGDEVVERPGVAGAQVDVRHADEGDVAPAPGACAAHAAAADARRRLATGQVADQQARRSMSGDVLGGHALVVVAEGAQPAGRGGIGVDVDELAAIAQVARACRWSGSSCPAKLASVPKTRSSSVGWPHDSWIWSATWVESRIRSISPGRALRRIQQGNRQLGGLLRVRRQVQRAHGLEAARHGLAAERVRVAALLHLVSFTAVASIPPPASTISCSIRAPALRGERLALPAGHHACPRGWRRPARAAMAASASIRIRSFSSRLTANGSSSKGVR